MYWVLDFTKIIVWPLLIFWGVFHFRKNLERFIDRINWVKVPGLELIAKQLAFSELPENSTKSIALYSKALEGNAKVAELVSEFNETQIENMNNAIAIRNLIIDFERTYRLILGSQIDFLERLKNFPPSGNALGMVAFFNEDQRNNPAFLYFLEQRGLIKKINQSYEITIKGQAFLTYITTMKYEKNKVF